MARFREYSYEQTVMLPVSLQRQLRPGTLEFAINYLVDEHIDRSVFESRYINDETGAPAIDPAGDQNRSGHAREPEKRRATDDRAVRQ